MTAPDLSPVQRIHDREATPIGELAASALKRAIMAAWEAGSITSLDARVLIWANGLQHK